MDPVVIGTRVLLAAFFLGACGEGAIAPEPSAHGRSEASSSTDEDDSESDADEDQSETDKNKHEAAPAPSTKDASVKHVSTPTGDKGVTDAGTTPSESGATPVESHFNAGAGTLLADGKTVKYRIPDGTGKKDWNPKDKPINVAPGMTLRLADDDSTVPGGHWLHTYGQPCPHGTRAIGQGYDCKISNDAPAGLVEGTFDHNIQGGGGRLYIVVVRDSAPSKGTPTPR